MIEVYSQLCSQDDHIHAEVRSPVGDGVLGAQSEITLTLGKTSSLAIGTKYPQKHVKTLEAPTKPTSTQPCARVADGARRNRLPVAREISEASRHSKSVETA